MSMALGALKDRMVMPDYSLVPWTSPGGKPMQIAAAAPNVPWTDLAYSLAAERQHAGLRRRRPTYAGRGRRREAVVRRPASMSAAWRARLLRTPGTDPTADMTGWQAMLDAGEPYGGDAQAIIDEITQHHSSYYIDHSIAPAPMLMSSGFTDDLFPADETIRYYNRTRPVPGRPPGAVLRRLRPHARRRTRRT